MNGQPWPDDLFQPDFVALQQELCGYAGAFDLLDGQLAWSRRWEYPWAVLNADLGPGLAALDAGAGYTSFGLYLAHRAQVRYHAVDPHQPSRDGFVEHARRLGLDVDYRLERLEQTSFEDGTFDRVFCISVVEHLPHDVADAAFREWHRVLKPGGLLVLTMDVNYSDTSRDVQRARAQQLLQPKGFRVRGEPPRIEDPDSGIYTNRPFWGTRFWPFQLREPSFLGRNLGRVLGYRIEGMEPSLVSVVGAVFERV